ncbi:MAG: septation protein A [Gammaproteobacteria bacterium]|nr:septation protein A [Gammaproteobacteria bacterium]
MKQLIDFFPILLFFILYKFYLDLPDGLVLAVNAALPLMALTPGEAGDAIYLATFAAIVVTLAQVIVGMILVKRVEKMPLVTLALLIVFGGATIVLRDPLFIQWKPTVINWLFALVFAGSHVIGDRPLVQRMMGGALAIKEPRVWSQLNIAWVTFFVVAGIANLLVAPEIDPLGFQFSEDTWVDFKLFGLMGMTIAFVVAQAFYIARYVPGTDEETS